MTLYAAGLLVALAAGAQGADEAAEAVRLARAGHHNQALERFQALAATNPADLDARVWIGRLLFWTGHRDRAERVFRNILEEAPGTVDALLGLGGVLAADGRLDAALEVLTRAERLHPSRADTLASIGRVHRLAGRTTLAVDYSRRAAALAPGDADVQQGLESARRQHGHRAQTRFALERDGDSSPATRAATVDINFRLADRLRIGLVQHVQGKFGRTESRTGAGVEWRGGPAWLVRGEVLAAPGAQVLPRSDLGFELERLNPRVDLSLAARTARFAGAHVWMAAPGVAVPLGERLIVLGRYYASVTRFDARNGSVVNHSFHGGVRAQIAPRTWGEVSYARGNESFETLSIDRIGQFRADTLGAGLRIDRASLSSFQLSAEYQQTRDASLLRLMAGVTQRF